MKRIKKKDKHFKAKKLSGKSKSAHLVSTKMDSSPKIVTVIELSKRDKVLQSLNLEPGDILSEAVRGGQYIFVTKNGKKIKAKFEK